MLLLSTYYYFSLFLSRSSALSPARLGGRQGRHLEPVRLPPEEVDGDPEHQDVPEKRKKSLVSASSVASAGKGTCVCMAGCWIYWGLAVG